MKDDKVVRFGVSIEKNLLEILDTYMVDNQFGNRSQAIRNLIRKAGLQKQWESDETVGGSIVISYDHEKRELLDKLTHIQHAYHEIIVCSQHIHLDKCTCMEIIAIRGAGSQVTRLTKELAAVKGIIHADYSLTMINTNEDTPEHCHSSEEHE